MELDLSSQPRLEWGSERARHQTSVRLSYSAAPTTCQCTVVRQRPTRVRRWNLEQCTGGGSPLNINRAAAVKSKQQTTAFRNRSLLCNQDVLWHWHCHLRTKWGPRYFWHVPGEVSLFLASGTISNFVNSWQYGMNGCYNVSSNTIWLDQLLSPFSICVFRGANPPSSLGVELSSARAYRPSRGYLSTQWHLRSVSFPCPNLVKDSRTVRFICNTYYLILLSPSLSQLPMVLSAWSLPCQVHSPRVYTSQGVPISVVGTAQVSCCKYFKDSFQL